MCSWVMHWNCHNAKPNSKPKQRNFNILTQKTSILNEQNTVYKTVQIQHIPLLFQFNCQNDVYAVETHSFQHTPQQS